jgi:enamine deaminase RidA (YjgF/YER057c/UK114 family)
MKGHIDVVQPAEWPAPKGYANGVVTHGRTLYIAGQVGWNTEGVFASDDLVEQLAKALDNVLAVVRAAGGGPTDIVKMTIYVTDLDAYRDNLRAVGRAWRDRLGKHFPAMALVGVTGLVERRAKVEIEATACLAVFEDGPPGRGPAAAASSPGEAS